MAVVLRSVTAGSAYVPIRSPHRFVADKDRKLIRG